MRERSIARCEAILSRRRHPLYSCPMREYVPALAPAPTPLRDAMVTRLANLLRKRGIDVETFGAVFDIGSRDGHQAVELASLFPNAQIVTIECNPGTLELCRRTVAGHPRIRLIDKAIHSYTGRCQFHPIDPVRTVTNWPDGNPGASSLFVANGDYPAERYVQNTIEVDCIRLDALCSELSIDVIDLIWMDLQGAELLALQSAGALLEKTRYVYTEVSHRPLYHGQCLFDDIDAFLKARGFRCCSTVDRTNWQQDLIYENTRPLIDAMIPLAPEDRDTLELSVRSIRACVRNLRHIYVVGAEDPRLDGLRYIDERLFPFDKQAVESRTGSQRRSGWYLQQLLKVYFQSVYHLALDHVLAVDADTIFLNPCRFMDGGRPIFNFGDRYEPACFEHMTRLYPPLHRMMAWSGITHTMLFTRPWLRELHEAVEAHHSGQSFWEAFLGAIDPGNEFGASEAEIYFNFCLSAHPSEMTIRRFNWMNVSDLASLGGGRPDYICLHREQRTGPIDRAKLQEHIAVALEMRHA